MQRADMIDDFHACFVRLVRPAAFLAAVLILTAFSFKAFSVPMHMETNVREACRRTIAGTYLAAYDEARQAKNFIVIMEGKLKKLKVELSKAHARAAKTKVKASKKEYNVKSERAHQDSLSAIIVLESQVKEKNEILASAHKTAIDYAKGEKGLKQRLEKVFVFKKEKFAAEKGGYPFKLEYRSKCPKFRFQCPLTVPEARSLLKILDKPPETCRRYANFTREDRD